MKVNKKTPVVKEMLAGGAGPKVNKISFVKELNRSVLANLLWEDEFYEDGVSNAKRIQGLVHKVALEDVSALAIKARTDMKLRHVPLLLVREMARHPLLASNPSIVSKTLAEVIQRPDEITEFLAIYWKEGKTPLSAQVKKGLSLAFQKFTEYSLAKFKGNGDVKLRDALFLAHAKPAGADSTRYSKIERALKEQRELTESEILYKKIVDETLETPDTWEVALSAGADKKETFTRLMLDNKLGALAFLRNLRNMKEANVDRKLIIDYGNQLNFDKVLPFRFIAAARYAIDLEPEIEQWMFKAVKSLQKINGRTIVLVDVSGSMSWALSGKSDLNRIDAANGLAMLIREKCDDVAVYSFSDRVVQVPSRRGFGLRDAITKSQPHSGTRLGEAVSFINKNETFDRLIVITDEQATDYIPANAKGLGYIINVASNKNGINTGKWTTITGFSEAVIDYIMLLESQNASND